MSHICYYSSNKWINTKIKPCIIIKVATGIYIKVKMLECEHIEREVYTLYSYRRKQKKVKTIDYNLLEKEDMSSV